MALESTESVNISLEPYRIGNQIKFKATIRYWNKDKEEKEFKWGPPENRPLPQGLWNGLAPIIYRLQSGVLPSYKVPPPPATNGQGPQPEFDLSRTAEDTLPILSPYEVPPPTVDWPYSRRTLDQHDVDAGKLDEAGQTLPTDQQTPVRAPSYSGPYAEEPTDTEDDINKKALETYTPPTTPPTP